MSNRSELYSANQRLFDEIFAVMMVKTWVGFERTVFDQLSVNDDTHLVVMPPPSHNDFEDLPEGTSTHWADGTPLPVDPEENGHA